MFEHPITGAEGTLTFLTGRTSGTVKFVEYTSQKFRQVIDTKARMLGACGLGSTSRVLVLHPMAPWSIGQVFAEGALRCGAKVLPAGLALSTATLAYVVGSFRPNILCVGARNLQRLLNNLDDICVRALKEEVDLVLSAGEPVARSVRADVEQQLSCRVRDIYGCAELDALALESESPSWMWLVPDYEYLLRTDDGLRPLLPGSDGVLMARRPGTIDWFSTGDNVRVQLDGLADNPWKTPIISVNGRDAFRVKFGDGSAIGAEQLELVRQQCGLDGLQLVVRRSPFGDGVELLFASIESAMVDETKLLDTLLTVCVDFSDSYRASCIGHLSARRVPSALHFYETERQKAPPIIVLGQS